jgi:glutathione S-transferase
VPIAPHTEFISTPNGHKITLFLEESGLPYRIVPVDISKGEQFKAEFLAFSPNNRMPAIIDRAPADDGEAVGVFESGAILVYLAEKAGVLLPHQDFVRSHQWAAGGAARQCSEGPLRIQD